MQSSLLFPLLKQVNWGSKSINDSPKTQLRCSLLLPTVLTVSICSYKNTTNCITETTKKYISHSSGDQESQDQVVGRVGNQQVPSFLLTGNYLVVSSHVGKWWELPRVPLMGHYPFLRTPLPPSHWLLKAPLSKIILRAHSWTRCQHLKKIISPVFLKDFFYYMSAHKQGKSRRTKCWRELICRNITKVCAQYHQIKK